MPKLCPSCDSNQAIIKTLTVIDDKPITTVWLYCKACANYHLLHHISKPPSDPILTVSRDFLEDLLPGALGLHSPIPLPPNEENKTSTMPCPFCNANDTIHYTLLSQRPASEPETRQWIRCDHCNRIHIYRPSKDRWEHTLTAPADVVRGAKPLPPNEAET